MMDVQRDKAHPWSGAPGWDLLVIQAESVTRAVELSYAARRKMWHLFFQDGPEVIMYKPSGAMEDWADEDEWMGCDREVARALAPGDVVYTNFSGQVTRHKVTERQPDFEVGKAPRSQLRKQQVSQTGVLIRVVPPVPKSGGGQLDPAWFRRLP